MGRLRRVTVPRGRRTVQRASTRPSRAVPAQLTVKRAMSRVRAVTFAQVAALRSPAICPVPGRRRAALFGVETRARLQYDTGRCLMHFETVFFAD